MKIETIKRNIKKLKEDGFTCETIPKKLNEKYKEKGFFSVGKRIYYEDKTSIKFIKEV